MLSSAFYVKLFQVVEDPSLDGIISWSKSNNSFIVWDLKALGRVVLPKLGCNYSHFLSELKFYGFIRINGCGQRWEFGHEDFVRGRPELLNNMMLTSRSIRRAKKAKARANRKVAKALAKVGDSLQHMCLSS